MYMYKIHETERNYLLAMYEISEHPFIQNFFITLCALSSEKMKSIITVSDTQKVITSRRLEEMGAN